MPNGIETGGMPAPMGEISEEPMETSESSVTITKTAEGAYEVSSMTDEAIPEGEGGEVYRTAKEACLAAIAILDRHSDKDAEAAFAEEYTSGEPNKTMQTKNKTMLNKGMQLGSQY